MNSPICSPQVAQHLGDYKTAPQQFIVDETFICCMLLGHVSTMHREARQLQLLRQRFIQWMPWLRNATKADVVFTPAALNGNFTVTASWAGGEHSKIYDAATILRMGRVGCTKDYARAFVKEVLEKRGVL